MADSMAIDHYMAQIVVGGAVALCGERAEAGHPLMFGTGARGVPVCAACVAAAAPVGMVAPEFTATVTVGKRMADGTPVG